MTIDVRIGRPGSAVVVMGAVYFAASLLHFAHNAEYIAFYPGMPAWLTRQHVYGVWLGIGAVGALAALLLAVGRRIAGALVLAVWGLTGLDGLGHYTLAPWSEHTWMMNFTIGFEAVAGVLLACTAIAWMRGQRPGRIREPGPVVRS